MNRVYPSDRNFMWAFTLGALNIKHNLNINKDKCSEPRTGAKACTLQVKLVVAAKLNLLKHLWNVNSCYIRLFRKMSSNEFQVSMTTVKFS